MAPILQPVAPRKASRATRTIAMFAAGAAMLATLSSRAQGFAGTPAPARQVSVSMDVRAKFTGQDAIRKEMMTGGQTDEELHAVIADQRKNIFEHRMNVFRKRKPMKQAKLKAQYKIALANTILKAREIDQEEARAKAAGPQARPMFADTQTTPEENLNAFKAYSWSSGGRQQNKRPGMLPSKAPHTEKTLTGKYITSIKDKLAKED